MTLCDFCGVGPTSYALRSRSYPRPEVMARAEGHWLACTVCYAFIEDGNHDGLLKRAVDVYRLRESPKNDIDRFELDARKLHERFWMTRID
jgi:hypothetical protein